MRKLLNEMDINELRIANKIVVDMINIQYKIKNIKATTAFSVGDPVQFESRKRDRLLHGVVKKVNTTTIVVDVDGKQWRVSASILKPAGV
jgi:uncharacterized protein YkvS